MKKSQELETFKYPQSISFEKLLIEPKNTENDLKGFYFHRKQ